MCVYPCVQARMNQLSRVHTSPVMQFSQFRVYFPKKSISQDAVSCWQKSICLDRYSYKYVTKSQDFVTINS